MQRCQNCGTELPENAQFCGQCGFTRSITTNTHTYSSNFTNYENMTQLSTGAVQKEEEEERRRRMPLGLPLLGDAQLSAGNTPMVQGTPSMVMVNQRYFRKGIYRQLNLPLASIEESQSLMSKDLRLTIELVPRPCWYSNMRTNIPRAAWDKLRKQVYAQYHYCCGMCQINNVTLHCHEIWQYDETAHIQKLNGFIALCEMCHHCKHMGHTGSLASEGKLDLNTVIDHFLRVNQCSREEYDEHSTQAWRTWDERNKYTWTTDFGEYAHLIPPKSI